MMRNWLAFAVNISRHTRFHASGSSWTSFRRQPRQKFRNSNYESSISLRKSERWARPALSSDGRAVARPCRRNTAQSISSQSTKHRNEFADLCAVDFIATEHVGARINHDQLWLQSHRLRNKFWVDRCRGQISFPVWLQRASFALKTNLWALTSRRRP
jgi:hypothetical protein